MTLKVDVVQNTSGGPVTLTDQQAAKAWINFNGTGTISARDSFSTSSLTDNGNGNYTVSFSNNFTNANYAMGGWCGYPGSRIATFGDDNSWSPFYSTSSLRMKTSCPSGTNGEGLAFDVTYSNEIFYGDLA